MNKSQSKFSPPTPKLAPIQRGRTSFVQWFYDLPIRQKQLVGLLCSQVISIVGVVGIGAWLIVAGGRSQLLNQAKSELAVTEINYNIKINQMGFGFRGQSDNTAIIAATKAHAAARLLEPALREQVKQILQNEIKARKIEYATLVGKDLRIIANANAERTGETFNPNNLVSEVLSKSRQLKTSEIVSWAELDRESPPLPEGFTDRDALIRYTVTPVKDPDTGSALGALISGDIVNFKLPIVKKTVDAFRSQGYSAVYLRQPTGKFTLATSLERTGLWKSKINLPLPDQSLLAEAVDAKGEPVTRRLQIDNRTYSLAAKTLSNFAGEPVAVLVRGTPETALNQLLKGSLQLQLVVSVLALAAVGFLGILLGQAIAGPLNRLKQSAQEFSASNLQVRAEIFAADEIGQLAAIFNQMAENIQNAFEQLEANTKDLSQLNADLQEEVRERKQVESALRESQQRLQAIMDNTSTVIYLKDCQGRYLLINRQYENLFHITRNQIIGKTDREIFPSEIADAFMSNDQKILAAEMPLEFEETVPQDDGLHTYISIKFPLWDAKGKAYGVCGISTDITERKRTEAALKQAQSALCKTNAELELRVQERTAELARSNHELEHFAYIASHDLREPLRKIKSFTDLLVEDYRGQLDAQADKYLDYISDGSVRMQNLIKDLLTYSRLGRNELILEPTDLGKILEQVLLDLSVAIEENNAAIAADSLPTIQANPQQMAQLFQNLISNALKFRSDAPPQIRIEAQLQQSEWLISIRDNGIGIKPQYTERIFEIFQRLHAREKYSGTGIGLAVCRKIVERHGGRIWVESEPAQGSTFYFTVPAAG